MRWSSLISALKHHGKSYSLFGIFAAVLFFYASLTPSIIPRPLHLQVIVSSLSLVAGYFFAFLLGKLWNYLNLPLLSKRYDAISKRLLMVVSLLIILASLWFASSWQNSIRSVMGLPPLDTLRPFSILCYSFLLAILIVSMVRILRKISLLLASRLSRIIPVRYSRVLSALLIVVFIFLLVNNVLINSYISAVDSTYAAFDQFADDYTVQPSDPLKTGSFSSLIDWTTLARKGKNFTTRGPTSDDIAQFKGRDALEPIRVYVGLRSADSIEERAELALEELKRVGAFNRSVLVIVTPTGSGWIDPGAAQTVEYLHDGDTALVAVQYSYLPSSVTLFTNPDLAAETSRIVFRKIYAYWQALPSDSRPRLYVQGVSLGALGSESSAELYELVNDPINGAVWSGMPFPSKTHSLITHARNPGSPYYLPDFGDSSLVRFMGSGTNLGSARWGRMRIVYIQYPSDPVVFFSTDLLYKRPEWMDERGPGMTPQFRWYPVVTFLQVAADTHVALNAPPGFGHNYAPQDYVDAWVSITEPSVTDEEVQRLKDMFD
jgi:uncharacterized membrane protein